MLHPDQIKTCYHDNPGWPWQPWLTLTTMADLDNPGWPWQPWLTLTTLADLDNPCWPRQPLLTLTTLADLDNPGWPWPLCFSSTWMVRWSGWRLKIWVSYHGNHLMTEFLNNKNQKCANQQLIVMPLFSAICSSGICVFCSCWLDMKYLHFFG